MLYPVRFISLFAIVLTFSPLLVANPDVVFSDSGDYDGAYLKHELKDSKIKFLLSKDVTGITLPDEYFSVKKLVDFVEFEYVFANDELRIEFLRMLRMSIESKFTLQQFMTEVLKFLDAFKQWLEETKSNDGCATTASSSSSCLLSIVCLLWALLKRRLGKSLGNAIHC